MTQSKVKWHGNDNYNMNCDLDKLHELGFVCSSYNNDLAPSYKNKKENIQVFFFDLESEEMKAENIEFKFSVMKLDKHGEYLEDIGKTNSFEEMIEMVKKNEEFK